MKRVFFAVLSLLLAALPAFAQEQTPKAELSGGYAYAGEATHGWNASAAFNLGRHFGLVADFGGHYSNLETPGERERIRTHSYLFGPRLSARTRRATPFAHALFGVSHIATRAETPGQTFRFTDATFGVALGGGLDITLSRRLALRAVQADYLRTRFFGETQHKGRLVFGLVLRLGEK